MARRAAQLSREAHWGVTERTLSVRRPIATPAEQVYAAVSDLARKPAPARSPRVGRTYAAPDLRVR